MPFNPQETIKRALAVPVQARIEGALVQAGSAITSKISSKAQELAGTAGAKVQQTLSNFGLASKPVKLAEAAAKLSIENVAGKFKNLNRDLSITKQNGKVVLSDLSSNSRLAVLGDSEKEQLPASLTDENVTTDTETLKVTITQQPDGHQIVFDVMPSISESQQAQYQPFGPLHHPGEIQKYQTTSGRTWNLSAKLVSRNSEEASLNLRYINLMRSWVMPFYGQGTAKNRPSQLGLPPPILTLSAYGGTVIGPVTCVLETYNWDWPNDIDYIDAQNVDGEIVPFPVIVAVTLSLKETWSPAEFSNFDIDAYRNGKLDAAYSFTAGYSGAQPGQNGQTGLPPLDANFNARDRLLLRASEPTVLKQGALNNVTSGVAATASNAAGAARSAVSKAGAAATQAAKSASSFLPNTLE